MKEDKEMTVWREDEDEIRKLSRFSFWMGFLGGAPIWIFLTAITMMVIAVTFNF